MVDHTVNLSATLRVLLINADMIHPESITVRTGPARKNMPHIAANFDLVLAQEVSEYGYDAAYHELVTKYDFMRVDRDVFYNPSVLKKRDQGVHWLVPPRTARRPSDGEPVPCWDGHAARKAEWLDADFEGVRLFCSSGHLDNVGCEARQQETKRWLRLDKKIGAPNALLGGDFNIDDLCNEHEEIMRRSEFEDVTWMDEPSFRGKEQDIRPYPDRFYLRGSDFVVVSSGKYVPLVSEDDLSDHIGRKLELAVRRQ